jgi:hypothetical protein
MVGCYVETICGSKDVQRSGPENETEGQQMENFSPVKLLAAIATLSFILRRLDSLMLLTNV